MTEESPYWKIAANILLGSATIVVGIGLLGQNIIQKIINFKNSLKVYFEGNENTNIEPMIIMENENEKMTLQNKEDITLLRGNL